MAKKSHEGESLERIDDARVAIIQGSWHSELSDVMVKRCREILEQQGARVDCHVLPGCLELPLAAQRLAQQADQPEAIVAFGIIVRGDTDHYDVVRDVSIGGLGKVMLNENIPVIIEVLPVHKIEQAIERSSDNEFNKGIEAAHAAIGTIAWRRKNPK